MTVLFPHPVTALQLKALEIIHPFLSKSATKVYYISQKCSEISNVLYCSRHTVLFFNILFILYHYDFGFHGQNVR